MREAEKEVREGKEDLVIEGHPRVNPSLTSSPAPAAAHDLTTESLTCDPQPTPLPASSKVEITEAALTPHQTGAVSSIQRTGPVEREGGRGVLTSVELACVSLRVVDILPQLAVYLGVEYGEYESVVSSEPSPQRQSFSVSVVCVCVSVGVGIMSISGGQPLISGRQTTRCSLLVISVCVRCS